jgi:hypothetical protein
MDPAFESELFPEGSTSSDRPAAIQPYREVHYEGKRNAAYAVLIFTALMFGGSIVTNFIQADRTGAGSGINDTRLLSPQEARHFFEVKTLPPTTTSAPAAGNKNN